MQTIASRATWGKVVSGSAVSGRGQGAQLGPAQPVHRPFVHGDCAQRRVEAERGGVPVQYGPLQPRIPALDADPGQSGQQRPAVAAAAHVGPDIQILEVDPVLAFPGREAEEPECEADDLAVMLGYVREHGRRVRRQRLEQVVLGRADVTQRPLVFGEVADKLVDRGHIAGPGRPNQRLTPAPTGRAAPAPPWPSAVYRSPVPVPVPGRPGPFWSGPR